MDKSFKVIIIGDSFTGKTALLMRLGDGRPLPDAAAYDATIGVDCKSRIFVHGYDNLRVRLQLWDTAG